MKFTDLFIKRPVLAATVSLLILVLGLRALQSLPIRQYPKTESATITVQTTYFGADSQTMAGFITQPLEQAISQAQGIDYLSSSSTPSASLITATLRLNYDGNKALTEISALVDSVKNQLPQAAQEPVITLQTGELVASMYIGFYSETVATNKITDYLTRVVQPQLNAIDGVQSAEILGGRVFAMRAWLDPVKMAAHGVTASDINTALAANNFLSAIGNTKGQMTSVALTASTDLHTPEEFRDLVIRAEGNDIVRLDDVAEVTLGAEDYNFNVAFDGNRSVFVGINAAPDANVLDVIAAVREAFPAIQAQMPTGMTARIVYDGTDYIRTSIDEVVYTLAETLVIVAVVIFLFLGTLRSLLIPLVAMPLSLIGAFLVMLLLGYSINLLTLLALVLAIGLVVDDAIIVVENVDRHMKAGQPPLQGALLAARELAGPIIAMAVVLVAVYIPVGFQGGLTGALFTEFAFTLAGAVVISALIALTLSPMMCSRFLRASDHQKRFVRRIDKVADGVRVRYRRILHASLDTWLVAVVFGALILAGNVYLFKTAQGELAPQEDQGIVLVNTQGPPNATITQMAMYSDQVYDIAQSLPEYTHIFQVDGQQGVNSGFAGILVKPWGERERSTDEIQQTLQEQLAHVAGARTAVFQFPSLPGAFGLPVQFVIKTTEPFQNLSDVSQKILDKAQASGMFFFVDSDLKIDQPQATVTLDPDEIAALGLTQRDVGSVLSAALGGNYVNYFSIAGRAYRVISQVGQAHRLNPAQLQDYYIKTPGGTMVPASTVAHLTYQTVPQSVSHFQQLNSATISGVIAPAVSLGGALAFMQASLDEVAPSGYSADYAGPSRQFQQESGGFLTTLMFAIIIVYLALAAQFESFRDPLVILVSVPMAIFGALLFINLGLATLNIYTEVGLVTLIGLISKHGILIVQFANDAQRERGLAKREAIEEAAAVRLRPILMTTFAMVLGVIPLVIASGAGAAGRRPPEHRPGDLHRHLHRHAVHPVCGAGDVPARRRGSPRRARCRRWPGRRGGAAPGGRLMMSTAAPAPYRRVAARPRPACPAWPANAAPCLLGAGDAHRPPRPIGGVSLAFFGFHHAHAGRAARCAGRCRHAAHQRHHHPPAESRSNQQELSMKYQASCHCGKVALEFEDQIDEVLSCNCSICQRKGSLLRVLPREQVRLLSPEDAAATYTFNKHAIRHRFCPHCGMHPYSEAADPQGTPMVAINVRCVEGIDPDALVVKHVDGRSF